MLLYYVKSVVAPSKNRQKFVQRQISITATNIQHIVRIRVHNVHAAAKYYTRWLETVFDAVYFALQPGFRVIFLFYLFYC